MIRHVPRREPRVLALHITASSLAFVVLDLVEMRSSGDDTATARSLRLALRRLIRRERPTAVVASGRGAERHLRAVVGDRVPVLVPPRKPLPFAVVRDVYREAVAFAPSVRLRRLASVATTTLARSTFPSRRYAKARRPRTPLRPQGRP
jgi:hypothetical protein